MEKTQTERTNKRRKGSRLIFGFTLFSMLFQTVLTFTLLLKSTEENKTLTKITTWLFIIYAVAFILLTITSMHSRRYEKESVSIYKTTMKWFKRIVKFILIVMSIMNIVTASKVDKLALIGAVALLLVNIFLISLDIFISGVKFWFGRKIKKWKRGKAEKEREKGLGF